MSKCVVCKCTDERSCEGGCYWIVDAGGSGVCSTCWSFAARFNNPYGTKVRRILNRHWRGYQLRLVTQPKAPSVMTAAAVAKMIGSKVDAARRSRK